MSHTLNTIGNTPLVKLQHLSPRSEVEVYAKLEFFNPSGSIKDRVARHIIEDAERQGLLKPGGTIVENTSGNTGAALAMIGAAKGYKVILTVLDKTSQEKLDSLEAFGAEVILCSTSAHPDQPEYYVNVAKKIADETPGSFYVNQYNNPKNPEAHYQSTGPEIWQQTKGEVTHFVASGSTGGTISGNGKYLKEQNPDLFVFMADPVGSIYYEYFKTGVVPEDGTCSYQVEGVGEDFLAQAMNFDVVDDMIQFTDQDAFSTARKLAKEEGIFGGGTGGANVWAALQLAEQIHGPAKIVTVIPDSGVKYLSKMYNDDWMKEKGFL